MNQQNTPDLGIIINVSRYTLANNTFLNLKFKTKLQNNNFTYSSQSNNYFVNSYSYLEFALNNVDDGSYNSFGINFIELEHFTMKLDKATEYVLKNQAQIAQTGQLDYGFTHVCGNNFKNSELSIKFRFDNNIKKLFVNFGYNCQADQKSFNVFSDMDYQTFRAFISELKVIKNSWHNIQIQNVLLIKTQTTNNYEENNQEQHANTFNQPEEREPIDTVASHNDNNPIEQAGSVMNNNMQNEDTPPWDATQQQEYQEPQQNTSTNTKQQIELISGLDGFSNDALDDF